MLLTLKVEEIVDHVRRKLNLDTRPQGSVRSNVNPDPDTSVILVPSDVKTFSSHTTMFSNFDCSYAEQLLMKSRAHYFKFNYFECVKDLSLYRY